MLCSLNRLLALYRHRLGWAAITCASVQRGPEVLGASQQTASLKHSVFSHVNHAGSAVKGVRVVSCLISSGRELGTGLRSG